MTQAICKCGKGFACGNPVMPHYGQCKPCYVSGMSRKARERFESELNTIANTELTWTTKDGTVIPVDIMTDSHARNCLKLWYRRNGHSNLEIGVNFMTGELARRQLKIEMVNAAVDHKFNKIVRKFIGRENYHGN